ncbi:MAG: ABC transporter substrate-binding protein [Candidatus Hydrogenedentota bacterium]|nr:MAG: ABC transporter substrate-binding protein [Candidatus Hydrogenedentota bacterium]
MVRWTRPHPRYLGKNPPFGNHRPPRYVRNASPSTARDLKSTSSNPIPFPFPLDVTRLPSPASIPSPFCTLTRPALLSLAAGLFLLGIVNARSVPLLDQYEPTVLSFDTVPLPPPRRIISLSLESDALCLGLVGDTAVLAVSSLSRDSNYSNFYELARRVPHQVGRLESAEPIVLLGGDLVVVNEFNNFAVTNLIESAGIEVFRLRFPRHISDIEANILNLGRRLHRAGKAHRFIARIEETRRRLKNLTADSPSPRVLYLSGGFWAEGIDSLANEFITAAGGQNVLQEPSRFVSLEEILFWNPDVLVVRPGLLSTVNASSFRKTLKARIVSGTWAELQPGTQAAGRALERWFRILHPEAFEKRDPFAGTARDHLP